MDTKHISVPLDPTAIAAKDPILPGTQLLAADRKGAPASRLVEESASTDDGDADPAATDADAIDPKAAKTRTPRREHVIHRTSGRLMHKHGGRR